MLNFYKTKIFVVRLVAFCLAVFLFGTCKEYRCHKEMVLLLKQVRNTVRVPDNTFSSDAKLDYMDSLLTVPHSSEGQIVYCKYLKANILLELGQEDEALRLFNSVRNDLNDLQLGVMLRDLGIAYLRQGERTNCIAGHSAESCLLPMRGAGVHVNRQGSQKAIETYKTLLARKPGDLESRWLLNIAYMTLDQYPDSVPHEFLIPGMEGDTAVKVKPFADIAGGLKLDTRNMAGGSIVEDFDNDGYLDLVTSSMDLNEEMHYFRNNADGTFTDLSEQSGLKTISGGLNMIQADYDNDGDRDIFVLRGAWKGKYGEEPNSLIRNNGNGTFTDVTTISGLLSFHPTQAGVWNDFNNDGWLDLFIGNESGFTVNERQHSSELYLSNRDGTFTEVAAKAGVSVALFVKGVTSGDYDNDGWQDIFLSTMSGKRMLLKNMGIYNNYPVFKDVSAEANIKETQSTFTTWFFDYDNDGWLDIFACDYTFQKSLGFYAAAEKLGMQEGSPDKILLYHNNHDGTFTSVAKEMGLNKVTFAMGGNFGDIDNDGYLDMYLGTGNPQYQSLVPNKMYKNLDGKAFADVTTSARVGHLQKGHGVSFADLDNDGDQDIHIDMGGAFKGDAYPSSLFLNPGQNNSNHWINIALEGTGSNRDAIGARIRITVVDNGVRRNIYRDLNSGGSFGSSPLRREIGVGQASMIEDIEILWPDKVRQHFRNIKPDQFIMIKEGDDEVQAVKMKKIEWKLEDAWCLPGMSL